MSHRFSLFLVILCLLATTLTVLAEERINYISCPATTRVWVQSKSFQSAEMEELQECQINSERVYNDQFFEEVQDSKESWKIVEPTSGLTIFFKQARLSNDGNFIFCDYFLGKTHVTSLSMAIKEKYEDCRVRQDYRQRTGTDVFICLKRNRNLLNVN